MACTQGQFTTPQPVNIEYQIFNNAGSTTYDVSLYAGIVTVGNTPIPWTNLGKGQSAPSLHQPTVAVKQIDTVTPIVITCDCSGTDNILYGITLQWRDACGKDYSIPYTSSLCCTGLTAAEIVAGLTTAINADPSAPAIASGSTTLVLTAKVAGQGWLTVINATMGTVVHSTANVISFGSPVDLAAKYNIPLAQFADLNGTYALMKIPYWLPTFDTANSRGSRVQVLDNHTLYAFVETGGDAEVNVLSGGGKLCIIFAGDATIRNYLSVSENACS